MLNHPENDHPNAVRPVMAFRDGTHDVRLLILISAYLKAAHPKRPVCATADSRAKPSRHQDLHCPRSRSARRRSKPAERSRNQANEPGRPPPPARQTSEAPSQFCVEEFGEVVVELVEDRIRPGALRALTTCCIPDLHAPTLFEDVFEHKPLINEIRQNLSQSAPARTRDTLKVGSRSHSQSQA